MAHEQTEYYLEDYLQKVWGGGGGVHCLLSEEPLCAGDVITQHHYH